MDIKNLAKALMNAQVEMERLVASSIAEAGKYSYKYADLAQVYSVVREPLSEHGVVILQGVSNDPLTGIVTVDCTLMHCESGEFKTDALALIPTQNTPQSIGSAISYARRYLLLTMLNLAPEDDDGNAASQGRTQTQTQPVQPKPTNGKPPPPVQPPPEIKLTPQDVRNQAVVYAMTKKAGAYNAQKHAEATYDKLAKAHPDVSLVDLKRLWVEVTEVHILLGLLGEKTSETMYKLDLNGLQALVAELKARVHDVEANPFDDADAEAEAAVAEARAEA